MLRKLCFIMTSVICCDISFLSTVVYVHFMIMMSCNHGSLITLLSRRHVLMTLHVCLTNDDDYDDRISLMMT